MVVRLREYEIKRFISDEGVFSSSCNMHVEVNDAELRILDSVRVSWKRWGCPLLTPRSMLTPARVSINYEGTRQPDLVTNGRVPRAMIGDRSFLPPFNP